MYSVVLMAALTAMPATPAWHHRGCGCWGSGGYSCCGCYGGGCYGCSGYYGGWSYSCSGCYGSSWGYSCMGCWGSSCYGCCGGWGYSCSGCCGGWGYSCSGCCGGWGYSCCGCCGGGCYGAGYGYVQTGIPVETAPAGAGMGPEPVGPPSKGSPAGPGAPAGGIRTAPGGGAPPSPGRGAAPTRTPGGTTALPGAAHIVVQLPKDATLYVDDHLMKTPTGHRTFTTPPLAQGQAYYYIFRADVVRNGKTQSQQKRVIVRAGDTIRANFDNQTTEATVKANPVR